MNSPLQQTLHMVSHTLAPMKNPEQVAEWVQRNISVFLEIAKLQKEAAQTK